MHCYNVLYIHRLELQRLSAIKCPPEICEACEEMLVKEETAVSVDRAYSCKHVSLLTEVSCKAKI